MDFNKILKSSQKHCFLNITFSDAYNCSSSKDKLKRSGSSKIALAYHVTYSRRRLVKMAATSENNLSDIGNFSGDLNKEKRSYTIDNLASTSDSESGHFRSNGIRQSQILSEVGFV